jgi:phosphopantetheinyl transferase
MFLGMLGCGSFVVCFSISHSVQCVNVSVKKVGIDLLPQWLMLSTQLGSPFSKNSNSSRLPQENPVGLRAA